MLQDKLASRPKFCPRPRPCPPKFVLDISLNFSFASCEIVCNASIGNISELAVVSQLCYLLTDYVHGCCYENTYSLLAVATRSRQISHDWFYLFNTAFFLALSLSSASKVLGLESPGPQRFVLGLGLDNLSSLNITTKTLAVSTVLRLSGWVILLVTYLVTSRALIDMHCVRQH